MKKKMHPVSYFNCRLIPQYTKFAHEFDFYFVKDKTKSKAN